MPTFQNVKGFDMVSRFVFVAILYIATVAVMGGPAGTLWTRSSDNVDAEAKEEVGVTFESDATRKAV